MSAKDLDSAIPNDFAATVNVISELQRQEALLKAGGPAERDFQQRQLLEHRH